MASQLRPYIPSLTARRVAATGGSEVLINCTIYQNIGTVHHAPTDSAAQFRGHRHTGGPSNCPSSQAPQGRQDPFQRHAETRPRVPPPFARFVDTFQQRCMEIIRVYKYMLDLYGTWLDGGEEGNDRRPPTLDGFELIRRDIDASKNTFEQTSVFLIKCLRAAPSRGPRLDAAIEARCCAIANSLADRMRALDRVEGRVKEIYKV
jgi:hypothetical protein